VDAYTRLATRRGGLLRIEGDAAEQGREREQRRARARQELSAGYPVLARGIL
jgi:hypothetical protein